MKLTRSTYHRAPCWIFKARWLYAHADWNLHWPFGGSTGLYAGPYRDITPHCRRPRNGILLDLNAAFGEPNRLHVTLGRWHLMLGLLTWWRFRATGQEGRVIHGDYVRCLPRLTDWPPLTIRRTSR